MLNSGNSEAIVKQRKVLREPLSAEKVTKVISEHTETGRYRNEKLRDYQSFHCIPQREAWLELGPDVQILKQ